MAAIRNSGPAAPEWLTARPVAHRGLHSLDERRVENSIPAFEAAIAADCAIELDVQLSFDGELLVFHDDNLKRLCDLDEPVAGLRIAEMRKLGYLDGPGTIPSLHDVLEMVGGRVPLIIEIKTDWQTYGPREDAVLRTLAGYEGPAALMSFDPAIMTRLRKAGLGRPLGLVAELFERRRWQQLTYWQRMRLRHFGGWKSVKPDFAAYRVDDLPNGFLSRQRAAGLPVLAWTVRTAEQLELAQRFADTPVFEGLDPAVVRQKHGARPLAGG